MRLAGLVTTTLIVLAACTAGPAPSPSPSPTPSPSIGPSPSPVPSATPGPSPSPIPSPSPSPSPTPIGGELSPAQARYLLIDQLGPLHYCDPDEYPVSQGDEPQRAIEQFPIIEADVPTFDAITLRLAIADQADYDDAEILAIYREWKALNAVDAQPLGNGTYQFDVTTEGDAASGRALHIQGTVDAAGAITVASQEEIFGTSCPICLAAGTLIDTPDGPRRVEDLRPGDPIWTVDATGRRIASTVARAGSAVVPASHQVVDLVLSDGRSLRVSPGHLMTDGGMAGDLRAGDELDGATVLSAELVAYDGGRTYDVLPGGSTGFYWANGIRLASTLR